MLYLAPPGERKQFLSNLEKESVLTPKTICHGDWNCLADGALDLRYLNLSKDPNAYPNAHGNMCEALLTRAGRIDTFKLAHGNDRDYTRRRKTVWTRLDRFYGPARDSNWRWTEVATCPLFYRGHDSASDHLAVKAKIEWAKDRKATKAGN